MMPDRLLRELAAASLGFALATLAAVLALFLDVESSVASTNVFAPSQANYARLRLTIELLSLIFTGGLSLWMILFWKAVRR